MSSMRTGLPAGWRPKEAQETLAAIHHGAVDAFVVEDPEGTRVYALQAADLPYSTLVERMRQPAAILNPRGEIIYCNLSLAQLAGRERDSLLGMPMGSLTTRPRAFDQLLQQMQGEAEMQLLCSDKRIISAAVALWPLSPQQTEIGVLITDLTSQKQHARLASRMQQMQDEERRRIARELHDSVGQLLTAIALNIARVQRESHKLSPETSELVEQNADLVKEISDEIRTISHLLHPPLLDEVGLPSAIRWYVDGFSERSQIGTSVEIPEEFERLPREVELALFRTVQECLSNVHRHSHSGSCRVKLSRDRRRILVEVSDSGCGMPPEMAGNLSTGGVGLRGMQERLLHLGGSLQIESSAKGTTVRATVPIPAPEDVDFPPDADNTPRC